jgi:hypothetical protein
LEWLLIVAAIAGLAAGSVLAVQRVLDDSTDRPPRDGVRIVDAEIEAAKVAHEATEHVNEAGYDDSEFKTRCEEDVLKDFSDVVLRADWEEPKPGTPPTRAECNLKRLE